jgi:sulfoxide reductase heme-binding subunit YedZ
LALTSTARSQRYLKKRWKQLHRGVYLAALLIVLHVFWVARSDLQWSVLYALIVFVLLFWRTHNYRRVRALQG